MLLFLLFLLFAFGTLLLAAFLLGRWTAGPSAAPWQKMLQSLRRLHRDEQIDDEAFAAVQRTIVAEMRAAGHTPPRIQQPQPAPRPVQPKSGGEFEIAEEDLIEAELVSPDSSPDTVPSPSQPPAPPIAQRDEQIRYVPSSAKPPKTSAQPSEKPRQPHAASTKTHEETHQETPQPPKAPWDFPDEPPTPPRPKRTWGELLQAFMEDKNIRWGELLSGMLIIGSATGLVLSLREPLQETIPYFPSLMFLLLIGMVHFAGLYTYGRWKLETTSRGVLTIGMLLIPLGLLAACLLSTKGEVRAVTDPAYLLAVTAGLGSYAYLCFRSSAVLMPGHSIAATISIVGASASTLFIHRLAGNDVALVNATLGAVPVLLAAVAPAAQLLDRNERDSAEPPLWDDARAERFASALGLSGFAALVALAYWQHKLGGVLAASTVVAPVLALGLSMLSIAGIVWQSRCESVRWRLTGAVTGLTSIVLVATCFALAWPHFAALMTTGVVSVIVFTVAASMLKSPLAACGAVATLIPTWVLAALQLTGDQPLTPLLRDAPVEVLFGPVTAWSLTTLFGALGVAAWFASRIPAEGGRREPLSFARALGICAALVGGLGWLTALAATMLHGGTTAEIATSGMLSSLYGLAAILGPGLATAKSDTGSSQLRITAGLGSLLLGLGACQLSYAFPATVNNWTVPFALSGLFVVALEFTILRACYWPLLRLAGGARDDRVSPLLTALANGSAVAVVLGAIFWPQAPYWAAAAAWWLAAAVWTANLVSLPQFRADTSARRLADSQWAAAQWLAMGGVAWSALSIMDSRVEWTSVLDGILFQAIAGSLALAAMVLGWQQRRLRRLLRLSVKEPEESAFHDVVSTVLALLTLAICGHVVLAAAAHWGEASRDVLLGGRVLEASGWAITNLALLTGIILARSFRQLTCVRIEGLGLLTVALLARIATLQDACWPCMSWALSSWLLVFAAGVRLREPLGRKWRELGGSVAPAQGLPSAIAAIAIPVCLVALLTTWRDWQLVTPWTSHTLTEAVLQAGPIFLVAVALMVLSAGAQLPLIAWAGGIFATLGSGAATVHVSNQPWELEFYFTLCLNAGVAWVSWSWLWWATLHSPVSMPRNGAPPPNSESDPLWLHWRKWIVIAIIPLAWVVAVQFTSVGIRPGHDPGSSVVSKLLTSPSAWWLTALSIPLAWLAWGRQFAWQVGLATVVAASSLLIGVVDARDAARLWHGYYLLHSLVAVVGFASSVTVTIQCGGRRPVERAESSAPQGHGALVRATLATLCISYLLSLQAAWHGPNGDYWAMGGCLVGVGASLLLSLGGRVRGMAWFSTLLAASITAIASEDALWTWVAVLGAATGWALAHIWLERRGDPAVSRMHRWTAGWSIALSTPLALLNVFILAVNDVGPWNGRVGFTTKLLTITLAQLALTLVCLWDRRTSRHLAPTFFAGWVLILACVPIVTSDVRTWPAIACVAWAGWLAAASRAWRQRAWWNYQLTRLGSPPSSDTHPHAWLATVVVSLSVLLTVASVLLIPQPVERWTRFLIAFVPLLTAVATGQLVRPRLSTTPSQETDAPSQMGMRLWTLAMASLGVLFVSWADIHGDGAASALEPKAWLERLVRSVTVFAIVSILYGAVAPRVLKARPRWVQACRHTFLPTLGLSLGLFLLLLGCEWSMFNPARGAPIPLVDVMSVAVIVAMLAAALTYVALTPKRDPLQLSDQGRVAYVYAAQAVLGLLALHLYLCVPYWFQLGVSWAYIAMGLAFGGALLGHILERSGFPILGQPSIRVALLLPLASLAGHLAAPDQSSLSIVFGAAAVLFALLAAATQQWWCGAVAVVLGNATLWSFYRETELATLLHNPQAWLVPPALSTLIASQLFRDELGKQRLAAIRYASAGVIYISSASELFIHGFGESLWPPMALAVLSVLGVFAGIGFKIRAFLYFGASFLLTAMIAMVSHAGRAFGHVWPWWAFGITMGVAILLVFGLFEKHRDESRKLLQNMKSWDA